MRGDDVRGVAGRGAVELYPSAEEEGEEEMEVLAAAVVASVLTAMALLPVQAVGITLKPGTCIASSRSFSNALFNRPVFSRN